MTVSPGALGRLPFVWAVALGLFLAACSGAPSPDAGPVDDFASPQTALVVARIEPAAGSALAALPPPSRAPDDAHRLVGYGFEQLQDALGPAPFVRRDGPAQIWRYEADECYFDVFLYRGKSGLRVTHVETRARGIAPVATGACYDRIIALRRPAPAG
ncbi:MAG: hypothetical protein HY057_11075 [Rhodospirillales bacterium]|nr:hypothetical protein [Rhodospirillales bacterium]